MTQLTKNEIQEQLKKLGIHSSTELNFYSQDYKKYSHKRHPLAYTPREIKNTADLDKHSQYHVARKFAQTCRSLFPVLGNFFNLSRVRAYKK